VDARRQFVSHRGKFLLRKGPIAVGLRCHLKAANRLTEQGDGGIDGIHCASLPTVLRQSFAMRATWMEGQPGIRLLHPGLLLAP
jgi:hypothetical protein